MTELKRSRQNKVNEYLSKYAFFAFSEEQFRDGLKKLGAKEEDLLPLSGTGGFILRDKAQGLYEILKEIDQEKQAALSDPESAYKLFLHALADHEYSYTGCSSRIPHQDEGVLLLIVAFTWRDRLVMDVLWLESSRY